MSELTLEEKRQKVAGFRPIDDAFFEVLADDKDFCTEILRVILGDAGLTVDDVIVQGSEWNLYGRSVRLDALCTLGSGKKVNVEVQRADNDDHARRVRFNAAVITARDSQTGTKFKEMQDLYVVYISESDIFKGGLSLYHVDSVIRENGQTVDDGLYRIFANTACDDGSDVAELMSCFTQEMVDNAKFPVFTDRMHKLKEEEGGVSHMCEIMERYNREAAEEGFALGMKQGRAEGLEQGLEQGLAKGRIDAVRKMIKKNYDMEDILDLGYSEAEYNEAEASLMQTV